MKVIRGDLLQLADEGNFDAIVHGCNCFHAMASGIAGQIRVHYPEAVNADYKSPKGAVAKLGNYSKATIVRGDIQFEIINAYTQFQPGPDFMPTLFPELLRKLNKEYKGKYLGFPRIGCGIGGGNWEEVEDMLLKYLPDVDVTVVVYDPSM